MNRLLNRWSPRAVYASGVEPDPRLSLANERTFLAWIRTSLAFSAAGVGLEVVSTSINPKIRLAASLTLLGIAILIAAHAWFAWAAVERAMREQRPLPSPRFAPWVAAGSCVALVMVAVGITLS